jgi:hypothetical protein
MSYQTDQVNTKNLIRDAVENDLLKSLSDSLQRYEIARKYDFSNEFSNEFVKETSNINSYEDLLEVVGKIMRYLYRKQTQEDKLGKFRYVLSQRGFSNNFIDAFDRLATKQIGRKSDVLTMHFSKDLSLPDLAHLENVIDSMYRDIIRYDNRVGQQIKRRAEHREPIIRIRQFTHPGSCEVFIDCRDTLILAETIIASSAVIIFSAMTIIQSRRNRRRQMIVAEFMEASEARQRARNEEQSHKPEDDEVADEEEQIVAVDIQTIQQQSEIPQGVVETL